MLIQARCAVCDVWVLQVMWYRKYLILLRFILLY